MPFVSGASKKDNYFCETIGQFLHGQSMSFCYASLTPDDLMFGNSVERYLAVSNQTKESGSTDTLFNFLRKVRSNGVTASITIVHIRKSYKMCKMSLDSNSVLEWRAEGLLLVDFQRPGLYTRKIDVKQFLFINRSK